MGAYLDGNFIGKEALLRSSHGRLLTPTGRLFKAYSSKSFFGIVFTDIVAYLAGPYSSKYVMWSYSWPIFTQLLCWDKRCLVPLIQLLFAFETHFDWKSKICCSWLYKMFILKDRESWNNGPNEFERVIFLFQFFFYGNRKKVTFYYS